MIKAVRRNMILFRFNRTWVDDPTSSKTITFVLRFINVISQLNGALALMIETYLKRNNIAILSYGLCSLFAHEPCVPKFISVIRNRKPIENILNKLESELLEKFKIDERERRHIEDADKFVSKYFVGYILFTFVGCSSWTTFPLFKKLFSYLGWIGESTLMHFPIPTWTPLDIGSGYQYALAYFLDVYYLYSIWAIWVGADVMFAGMLLHLSAHFKILSGRIRDWRKGILVEISSDVTLKKRKIDFRAFLAYHLEILSICKDVNGVFTQGLFHQLVNVTVVICFCGINAIVTSSSEKSQTISMLLVLFSMTASWFVCCYVGTTIISESQRTAESIYFSDWIHFTPEERKTARFILQRCQEPVSMTAGKYFRISLATFLDMMKMSYSLLAVLREVYD